MKRVICLIVLVFCCMVEVAPWYGRRGAAIFPLLGVSRIALGAQDVFYCPYHPEKPYDAPGRCPRCGRTLKKMQTEPKEEAPKEHRPHHKDAPLGDG